MDLKTQLPVPLANQLGMVRTSAIEIWHSPQHRHYTDHKPDQHSERIIAKLNAMSRDMAMPLSANEIFILLAATYLHDIGMQYRPSTEFSLDDIRDKHHELSKQMIEGSITDPSRFRSLGLTAEFADEVALVAAAHRKLNLSSPEFDTRPKGDGEVRLRLLSAMLRLADALDLDYNRVIIDNLYLEDVNAISRLHWWRCHYVEGIAIRNGSIHASCAVPTEDYAYYIRASLDNEIRVELEKVRPFLWPQIKLSIDEVTARVSATKRKMSTEDFDALRAQVREEIEKASQASNAQIVEMRGREERAAHEAAQEGRRLAGSDPPVALKNLNQAVTLFARLGQPHAMTSHLEKIAEIHAEAKDDASIVQVQEKLGQLYMNLEEPFRARAAFTTAQEKSPEDLDSNLMIQLGLNAAVAGMFWGDFQGLPRYFEEVNQLAPQITPQISTQLFNSRLLFHQVQNQRAEALEIARQGIEDIIANASVEIRAKSLNQWGYTLSLTASLAGEHDLALLWLSYSFNYHAQTEKSGAVFPDADLMQLHARRGFIRSRMGHRATAMRDFFAAVRLAEKIGDELSLLINLENATVIAGERPFRHFHPFIKSHWDQMRDLGQQLRHLRDLPSDGGDDSLADNLSKSLFAFHKSFERNDIRGLARARASLARIHSRAGHTEKGLGFFLVAGTKTEDIAEETNSLIKQSERRASDFFHKAIQINGASNFEWRALATMIRQGADFLPDADVEVLVERLLERIKIAKNQTSLICDALGAIAELSRRLSNRLTESVALLCVDLLKDKHSYRFTVRAAAAKALGKLATHLPRDSSLQSRLPLSLRTTAVETLISLTSDEGMGRDALINLLDLGLPLQNLSTESDEIELRERVKRELVTLALEKRWRIALQICVSTGLHPVKRTVR